MEIKCGGQSGVIKKMLIFSLMVAALFGLNACARKVNPEDSCNFVQNSLAQRVSWGAQTPVTLYIDSSVPQEFYPAIESAIEVWNRTYGRSLLVLGGVTNSSGIPARDGANIIYWMNSWEENRRTEQARTVIHWAGDRIYESDVRINARHHRYTIGRMPGYVDLTSLLVHEFGHVLGLSHTEENGSVMAKTLASNMERREPAPIDVRSLRCEY